MTDGMALSFVNEEDCGFFGPSSNIAFMRHIFRAMSKKGITSQGRSPDSPLNIGAYQASMISVPQPVSSMSVQEHNGELENAVQANILPPEEETEKLIRSYFSNTGLLFPFIHEDTFLATYNRMRDQHYRANIRRTWLGLLNMIVAMAILQYLLLTSQYLQGTQRSVQTWTTHGLAVKAALSIGLHSRDVMARFTPIEQEMRKRTWFGCVLLDRSLSMTFGRPGAIPEEYIQLDLPTIIPLDDGTEATLLYRVLWKIVATLYGHNLASVETPPETWMITQIFQLEQELNNWASALPSPLFLRSSTNLPEEGDVQDDVLERFRVVLSLRYLSVQLLLYRPVLADSLARGTSGEKQRSVSKVQANFNFMCVQVAEDIINIIHAVLTKPGLGRHLMGAWWFTLYYTFNAALVLFGSLLVPIQDTANDPFGMGEINRTKQYLEKAVQGLVQLGARNITLHRCVDYLKQLVGLLDSWGSSPPLHLDGPGSNTLSSNAAQDANLLSDLLSRPPALEGPGVGFEDDLELGNFFTSEFQRWFDRFPT
uniref:Xylanolytic transcriptional activator regulatory domain-containing protein n=1 Tax=Bionectria ochroleuca TaxID=29856 RepID=A0A0B7JQX4_BIOOC